MPFYTAIENLNLSGPVLDAGCGSGEGARALCEAGRDVVAIELDHGAAHFAREYAPGARVIEADLCTDAPVTGACTLPATRPNHPPPSPRRLASGFHAPEFS